MDSSLARTVDIIMPGAKNIYHQRPPSFPPGQQEA